MEKISKADAQKLLAESEELLNEANKNLTSVRDSGNFDGAVINAAKNALNYTNIISANLKRAINAINN